MPYPSLLKTLISWQKDIKGIGFRSADTIALNMGIPKDSILRARAGISYVLSEASSNLGHACLPKDELIKMANELLEMPEQTICDAIEKKLKRILWYLMIIRNQNVFISLPFLFRSWNRLQYKKA